MGGNRPPKAGENFDQTLLNRPPLRNRDLGKLGGVFLITYPLILRLAARRLLEAPEVIQRASNQSGVQGDDPNPQLSCQECPQSSGMTQRHCGALGSSQTSM